MSIKHILTPFIFSLFSLFIQAQDSTASKAQEVKTGIFLMNIYDLDINTHSFYADFYIWFKWKGELNPCNIEFVNAVEKWGFTNIPFHEEPRVLPDGYNYNGMRIEGRFYYPFELGHFPLDQHALSIHIENVEYPIDSLVYVPDSNGVFVRANFLMPGWNIGKVTGLANSNLYPTNFGETGVRQNTFSTFTFQLNISRPVSYFLLKLLLPLLITVLVSLGALFINAQQTDARISVPIGCLLAVVFLQQSYSSALPDVGYMVLMDKIYLLVYGLISGIMMRVIWVANLLARHKKQIDLAKVRKVDRILSMSFFLLLLLGMLVMV